MQELEKKVRDLPLFPAQSKGDRMHVRMLLLILKTQGKKKRRDPELEKRYAKLEV